MFHQEKQHLKNWTSWVHYEAKGYTQRLWNRQYLTIMHVHIQTFPHNQTPTIPYSLNKTLILGPIPYTFHPKFWRLLLIFHSIDWCEKWSSSHLGNFNGTLLIFNICSFKVWTCHKGQPIGLPIWCEALLIDRVYYKEAFSFFKAKTISN
jgi:hypothetical protein